MLGPPQSGGNRTNLPALLSNSAARQPIDRHGHIPHLTLDRNHVTSVSVGGHRFTTPTLKFPYANFLIRDA